MYYSVSSIVFKAAGSLFRLSETINKEERITRNTLTIQTKNAKRFQAKHNKTQP